MSREKAFDLMELRSRGLPRCVWSEVLTNRGDAMAPEDEASLEDYFRHFLKPGQPCVGCGAQQGGDWVAHALGLARFTWGLVNGEGHCSDCGYPARAIHRDVGPAGDPLIERFNCVMQYHPDELIEVSPCSRD